MSTAAVLDAPPDTTDADVAAERLRELARGAVEPFSADWAYALNAVARWVLDHETIGAWHDFRRAWLDLRRLFGPASALRLLNMPEVAALVPDDAD